MAVLPLQAPGWLDQFKARLALESSVLRILIQWGLTECAFDIYKKIEEQCNDALESRFSRDPSQAFRLSEGERNRIREILREHYLRTRGIPRRRGCQELLHNGLLTGFEELGGRLAQLYEDYLQGLAHGSAGEKAA